MTLYFKGQAVLIFINILLFWAILTFLRIKYALIFAVITGFLSIIPTFGILISAFITFVFSFFDNQKFTSLHPLFEGFVILIFYLIINQIVDFLIYPFVMGKTLKIPPPVLILSVVIGSALFGIIGAILAVPFMVLVKTIYMAVRYH